MFFKILILVIKILRCSTVCCCEAVNLEKEADSKLSHISQFNY